MKKSNFIQISSFYIGFFILGTFLFIISFHTPLFENISILFYRGIFLLFLTSFLIIVTLIYFKKTRYGKFITIKDIILLVTLVFCLNLVFFTHLPVTADRSISVFLLGYLNNHSQSASTKNEINNVFIQKYLYGNKALEKRLNEQIASGDILQKGDKYMISDQGRILIKFYKFIADLFGIKKKNISS